MPERLANNAQTTLNGAITNSATSLTVTSASAFPTSGNFRILIDSEILLVTAVSGTTFTVTRGVEGTTGASHSHLATITHVLTAGALDQFKVDNLFLSTVEGRLTLQSGTAVPSTDQTAKTTVYFTPYRGNRIALYDGTSAWNVRSFSELSIAVPSAVFRIYDVFAYDNSGTVALEALAWDSGGQVTFSPISMTNASPVSVLYDGHPFETGQFGGVSGSGGLTSINSKVWSMTKVNTDNFTIDGSVGNGTYTSGATFHKVATDRATALTTQDGVLVKTGATTRRYLGSIMTTDTSGQCEDSVTKRFLWNYYNRVPRDLRRLESTSSWTYSTATERMANNSIDNRVQCLIGVAEVSADVVVAARGSTASAQADLYGFPKHNGATGAAASDVVGPFGTAIAGDHANWRSFLRKMPTLGFNYFAWLEKGQGSGTQTFYGGSAHGILATIEG